MLLPIWFCDFSESLSFWYVSIVSRVVLRFVFEAVCLRFRPFPTFLDVFANFCPNIFLRQLLYVLTQVAWPLWRFGLAFSSFLSDLPPFFRSDKLTGWIVVDICKARIASDHVVVQDIGSWCSFEGFGIPIQKFGIDAGRLAASCWSKHHQNGRSNWNSQMTGIAFAQNLISSRSAKSLVGVLTPETWLKFDNIFSSDWLAFRIGGGMRPEHERVSKKEGPPRMIRLSDKFTIEWFSDSEG